MRQQRNSGGSAGAAGAAGAEGKPMTRTNDGGAQRPLPKDHCIAKIRGIIVAVSMFAFMSNGFAFMTIGSYDCGQWFTEREPAKSWLLGFLSGMNAMAAWRASGDEQVGKLNSADQAFQWMDSYCKVNPLKSVADGAQELFWELRQRK